MSDKSLRVESPKERPFELRATMLLGQQAPVPPIAPDAGQGAIGLNVCPAARRSCFSSVIFYSSAPLFSEQKYLLCVIVLWDYVICFDFYRGSQLRVSLESPKRCGHELLKSVVLLRLWGEDYCSFFCKQKHYLAFDTKDVFISGLSMVQGCVCQAST